jgi:glycosyltransferase involved in cell wall biosynthesis
LPIDHQLNVLSLISSEGHFGAENMLLTLAAALNKLGCRSIVAAFCDSRFQHTEVADRARAQGLTVEIVPCNGRCDWKAVTRTRKLMVQHNVDVLHTHGYKADLYAYAAAWPRRVPLVATCHNWPSRFWNMRAYAALDRYFLRDFDRVVALSDALADTLRHSGVRPEKLETIANGVQVEPFQSAQPSLRRDGAFGEEALVGFVGRLVPGKGGDVLLHAAQRVLLSYPATKFVLVGEGPARGEWEALAQRLGIHDRVVFTGVRHDMPGVYASFSMLALPSLDEAMPMCVLEAMAASKPVVATRVGSVPKLVIPAKTGELVEPGNATALAEAMLRILHNPQYAHELAKAGQLRVLQHFSAESMAKRYLELYRRIAKHRNRTKNEEIAWGVS